MNDYTYPSIFFSYFLFFLFLAGGLFFFFRSLRHGYFGPAAEDVKYRMLEDDEEAPRAR
ncbi:MAG: hypothetical protein KIT09_00230 [Bryobacteraceae bacterium]|nr:hypothetical protein [Bryobacteraceae bacterium]